MLWGLILLVLVVAIAALLWRQRQQRAAWELELLYLTRHQKKDALPPTPHKISVTPVYQRVRDLRRTIKNPSEEQTAKAQNVREVDLFAPAKPSIEHDLSDLPIFASSAEQAVSQEKATGTDLAQAVADADSAQNIPEPSHAAPDNTWAQPIFKQDEDQSVLSQPSADLAVISEDEVLRRVRPRKTEPEKPKQPLKVIDEEVRRFRQKQAQSATVSDKKTITLHNPPHRDIDEVLAQNAGRDVPRKPPRPKQDGEVETIDAEEIRANLLRRRMARRSDDWSEPAPPPAPETIQQSEVLANLANTDSPANRLRHKVKRQMVRDSIIPVSARVSGEHTVNLSAQNETPPISTRFTPYQDVPSVAAPSLSMAQRLHTVSGDDDSVAEESWEETLARAQAENRAQYAQESDWRSTYKDEQALRVEQGRATSALTLEALSKNPSSDSHDEHTFWDEWQTASEAPLIDSYDFSAETPDNTDLAEKKTPFSVESSFHAASGMQIHHPHQLPNLSLLIPPQFNPNLRQSDEALLQKGVTIEEKLAEFKVKVSVVDAYAGPVITRYEIEPDTGVRGNQVLNLEKDLARALGCASIRIVETIPGKTCMGLELPNPKRQIIRLSEILGAPVFAESKSKLTLALGQDITGQPVITDLARAPHLLVAGTTGSGKSVGVNAMILSMLFKATPEEVRLIMIDPKMLELSIYEGIPHLLAPVVTDTKLAANALTWCVNEMEKRYRLMSHLGVRNLASFNQRVAEAAARGKKLGNPFSLTPHDPEPLEKLPFIVVVVDEFADLMMTAGKRIEELIARLAQKARAAGIHLILATQRPSVDVITGLIKANIPTRIAFQVSSKVDSRTIIDQMGAESLLGQGDMLFLPPGSGYPQRIHGAFVADEEVHRVAEYLKQFGEPNYIEDILTAGVGSDDLFSNANGMGNDSEADPLYDEAVAVVMKSRKASISSVQRHLRIGYNRAARLIEQMEEAGIVSAPEGNGSRTVLIPEH